MGSMQSQTNTFTVPNNKNTSSNNNYIEANSSLVDNNKLGSVDEDTIILTSKATETVQNINQHLHNIAASND